MPAGGVVQLHAINVRVARFEFRSRACSARRPCKSRRNREHNKQRTNQSQAKSPFHESLLDVEPIAQRLEVGGPAQALLALRLPAHFYQFNRTCPLEVFSSRRYPKPASLAGGMGNCMKNRAAEPETDAMTARATASCGRGASLATRSCPAPFHMQIWSPIPNRNSEEMPLRMCMKTSHRVLPNSNKLRETYSHWGEDRSPECLRNRSLASARWTAHDQPKTLDPTDHGPLHPV